MKNNDGAGKRRRGNSGYTKSGGSPPWRKSRKKKRFTLTDKNGFPTDWAIQRFEDIINMLSLDEQAEGRKEENSQTIGDALENKSGRFTATCCRTVALLKACSKTEKQVRLVEGLAEGYKPEEIKQELGLRSLSAVTNMIRRLRNIKLDGMPLKDVLNNLNAGLSIGGTSFGDRNN